MARQRDYKAEYAARIAKGQAQGLSRAQAAGHPRLGEPLKTQIPPDVPRSPEQQVSDLRGKKTTLTVESYTDEKGRPHNKTATFYTFNGSSMPRLERVIQTLAATHPDGQIRLAINDEISIFRHGQRADTTQAQVVRYGGGAGFITASLEDAYGGDDMGIDPYEIDWELSIEY